VWRRVILKLTMLQLEDELLGKGEVMSGVKVKWAGRPIRVSLGIRSSLCLGVK
jgi:hypothetical protein